MVCVRLKPDVLHSHGVDGPQHPAPPGPPRRSGPNFEIACCKTRLIFLLLMGFAPTSSGPKPQSGGHADEAGGFAPLQHERTRHIEHRPLYPPSPHPAASSGSAGVCLLNCIPSHSTFRTESTHRYRNSQAVVYHAKPTKGAPEEKYQIFGCTVKESGRLKPGLVCPRVRGVCWADTRFLLAAPRPAIRLRRELSTPPP